MEKNLPDAGAQVTQPQKRDIANRNRTRGDYRLGADGDVGLRRLAATPQGFTQLSVCSARVSKYVSVQTGVQIMELLECYFLKDATVEREAVVPVQGGTFDHPVLALLHEATWQETMSLQLACQVRGEVRLWPPQCISICNFGQMQMIVDGILEHGRLAKAAHG